MKNLLIFFLIVTILLVLYLHFIRELFNDTYLVKTQTQTTFDKVPLSISECNYDNENTDNKPNFCINDNENLKAFCTNVLKEKNLTYNANENNREGPEWSI